VAAGTAVEQLAGEYKDQPVLFLEYDANEFGKSPRAPYFWASNRASPVGFPIVSVDSGNQVASGGSADYRALYRPLVNSELARTPQAELAAAWWRVDNRVVVSVRITNQAAVSLGPDNEAKVHAIVYENNKVKLTSRFVRTTFSMNIGTQFAALDPGESQVLTLESGDLAGVDWEKLSVVAIADYYVDAASHYDALQAAPATRIAEPFAVSARTVTLLADPDAPDQGVAGRYTVQVTGSLGLTWTAAATVPWLSVTPSSGVNGTPVELSVDMPQLADGWQNGLVTFSAGGQFEAPVRVAAYRGRVDYVFLPAAARGR
jgi:hypothetical protein